MAVSVIVPIYNVEKYFDACMESLVHQTYQNLEIILVDDGSSDACPQMCDAWAKKDARIKTIHQENAGSGPARNHGLEIATGEFIVFVDPDDWIAADLIEQLLLAQNNVFDFVSSGNCEVVFNEKNEEVSRNIKKPKAEILTKSMMHQAYLRLARDGLVGAPTRKLYKSSIIKENNIKFPDLRRSQDIVFNYRYFDCCENLKLLDYAGYYYRIEPADRMLRIKENYYLTVLYILSDLRKLFCKWGVVLKENELETEYAHYFVLCFEANVFAHKDITPIMENQEVCLVFQKYTGNKLQFKALRFFIKHRLTWCIVLMFQIKILIKRVLHR